MKITIRNLTNFFVIILLISCNSPQTTEQKADTVSSSFSEAYKVPVFSEDDRMEKIKGIAPKMQELIEEHARERNIPGVAYGIVVDNSLVVASATGLLDIATEIPATTRSAFRIHL
jgi:CubicO group peptidase (beta-lactamase class C family)